MLILIGLIIGLALGLVLTINLPTAFALPLAVLLLSSLNSLLLAIKANLEKTIDLSLIVFKFVIVTLVSLLIVALGSQIDIPLSYAVFFALGLEIYQSATAIAEILWQTLQERFKK